MEETRTGLRPILDEEISRGSYPLRQSQPTDAEIDAAVESIEFAISYYRSTRPGIEGSDGRRIGKKPAETRRNLQALERKLAGVLEEIDCLDGDSKKLLGEAIDAPFGRYKRMLIDLRAGAEAATVAAINLPNKETNHQRVLLAAEVAVVLQGLGLDVSTYTTLHCSTDTPVYEKVLRFCLERVGEFSCDWKRLVVDGIAAAEELKMMRACR